MKEKINFYHIDENMSEKIKFKLILVFISILLLILMILSIFTFENSRDQSCIAIKREIALCNFMVTNDIQKKICLNKIKEKYGSNIFSKCIN